MRVALATSCPSAARAQKPNLERGEPHGVETGVERGEAEARRWRGDEEGAGVGMFALQYRRVYPSQTLHVCHICLH